MRIFVLGTGRCGSYSFIKACRYIHNFTAGHESKTQKMGKKRFDYPANHIEADNRLSWHLAELEQNFPEEVLYVHLKRNPTATAKSFSKRFFKPKSMVNAYAEGIKMLPPETLDKQERLQICEDYVATVTANVDKFLQNKTHLNIKLENISKDFEVFWNKIGAQGDLSAALQSFEKKNNTSQEHNSMQWFYRLKLFLNRQIKRLE